MSGAALELPPGAPDFEVWLKLEHLQVSGSFKARGMFNRLLSNPIPPAGVIAASGGNAGIATAVAARARSVCRRKSMCRASSQPPSACGSPRSMRRS
jgi:threonine dehydratase